jgi:hypothetical protein
VVKVDPPLGAALLDDSKPPVRMLRRPADHKEGGSQDEATAVRAHVGGVEQPQERERIFG